MTDCRYHVMENTTAQGSGFDCLTDGICNEEGHLLEPAFNNEEVQQAYALKRRGRPLGDWIAFVSGWLALSEKASSVFQQFNVCKSVRWVPLTVHDRREKPLLEGTLLYGPKRWDVIDLVQSEYRYFPDTEVIKAVDKWVLRELEIPPFDAFYLRELDWIVSAGLHDAIIAEGLTGFSFIPTAVS